MIIKLIARVLALLNSNSRAWEIGAGMAMGLLLAIVPSRNLLFPVLVLIAFLVKINLGLTILTALLFSTFISVLDPAVASVGRWFLTRPALQPALAAVYEVPLVRFTRFNDTLVMGSLLCGLAAFAPVTAVGVVLVRLYRRYLHPRIANSHLVKAIMATPLAQKISKAVRTTQAAFQIAG